MQTVTTQAKKKPLLSGLLILFLFAMILANLGGNMYGPLMPLYLTDLQASITQVGLFFTLSQIIPLLLQIIGGWVSDSLGRLRAIAIGSVVGIFVFIPLILAPTWQWLLLGEALGAITRSLVGPSFDAFIAEHSSEENRARVFGMTSSIFMVVSVIGPPVGGWLAGTYGFKFMLLIAAILYIMATVIRVGMAREAAKGPQPHARPLTVAGLKSNLGAMFGMIGAGGLITWILLTDGVRDVSFALSMNLFPVYMEDIGKLSIGQIGWVNGIFGLFMMLSTIPGGWLADKKGERVGIATGFILVGLSLFMLVMVPAGSFIMYAAGWSLAGVGVGLLTPAYQSLISKAVPQNL
ncbi:MAG: MFS transporter, partial [Chloroflexota bacterium]